MVFPTLPLRLLHPRQSLRRQIKLPLAIANWDPEWLGHRQLGLRSVMRPRSPGRWASPGSGKRSVLGLMVLFSSLLSPPSLLSAQSLSLSIVDRESRLPLAGVVVRSGEEMAVSDALGRVVLITDGPVSFQRLGYLPLTIEPRELGERRVVSLDRSAVPLPGLTVDASAGPLQVGRIASRTLEPADFAAPDVGLVSDPVASLTRLGIATRINDFTALPTIRAGRWDQNQLLLGSLRLWGPFHGLGVTGPARAGATAGMVVGGASPGIGTGNSTGTVIAALPRLDPGPLWLQGDASLADLSVSAGGSLPFQPDGAFVITGTRSIDTSALGSLLGGGGLPFTYSSLGAHAGGGGSGGVRFQFSGFASQDSTAFRSFLLSEGLSSTWQSLGAGGSVVFPLGGRTSGLLSARVGQYRANLVQTGGEGIQIQETRNELTDVEVSGQISGTTGWGIARGGLHLIRQESELESTFFPRDRQAFQRGRVTAMGGVFGLESSRGVWEWSAGVRADASAEEFHLQPRVEVSRSLGDGWRARS